MAQNDIQIIANTKTLRWFKNIDLFTIDLGLNLTGSIKSNKNEPLKIKVRDEFVKKYMNLNDRIVNKYGNIGTIKFYEDLLLSQNEFHIYHDNNIFEVTISDEDFNSSPKEYLTEIIKNIVDVKDAKNEKDEKLNLKTNISYSNFSPDELEVPDISIRDKDEYLNKLVNFRYNQK
jgi:hypothetical protein